MKYRELLNTVKNNPNCFSSNEERKKIFEYKYHKWAKNKEKHSK